ncbi:uncharacterized protein LOC117171720 isoform X1 [Belonocnema kinseyi]|uniref:uncharacterized protein LOC117171720 isoform X1 n=1 Tax=Belonocnema kinseyi TaxID=2817044 RepID=UPI00143CF621|nr:uncharacterized protein LOC117171720 isoform X1 [Belonocnema kinseyi]
MHREAPKCQRATSNVYLSVAIFKPPQRKLPVGSNTPPFTHHFPNYTCRFSFSIQHYQLTKENTLAHTSHLNKILSTKDNRFAVTFYLSNLNPQDLKFRTFRTALEADRFNPHLRITVDLNRKDHSVIRSSVTVNVSLI